MGTLRFLPLIVATLLLSPLSSALTTTDEAVAIANPQLVTFEEQHPNDHVHIDIGINIKINNPRLLVAHKALHALKQALYSDPNNFTGNWVGPDVCAYNGVSCVPSPHNESESAVASLDMNAADVAGYLPKEIGLMSDLAVLHLNSNRFCGVIPEEIRNMTELYELDASNNRFVGPFPAAVLGVPKLSYLDIRFNDFDGPIPPELFLKPYDAIFLNNNRFTSGIPETIGKAKATVIVLANNQLGGCIPRSIGEAAATLDQFIFINNSLTGCLPVETGLLTNATVFDVSDNALTGSIPPTLAGLSKVEQLDLSLNMFTGDVPSDVCKLPALANLSVSYNFFTREASECSSTADASSFHDDANCMGQSRHMQRGADECTPVVSQPVDCTKVQQCGWPSPPPLPYSPPPVASPPPPRASPPPPPIIIPPVRGTKYQSPPPPLFPGY
ncbi:pollen-specific leucine-rich repeat extensin-like protein 1 [Miscanthus floridulus]|uniref:pollen-specific leucine-rich repeat extensin-like protein 1 n=1 Tax=Miscanthus floridulus TaxID=154761 RepID=UPI00345A9519